MSRYCARGFTLIEIVIALTLSAIVMALVGSLFVGSLSAWRRGSDLREAQVQAATLAEVMARDIRSASQARSVTIRPQVALEEGEPILSIRARGVLLPGIRSQWILYVYRPNRRDVVRQVVTFETGEKVSVGDERVVATEVERVAVEHSGNGVTIEVRARRRRDVATSRVTAAPRNP